MGGKTLETPVFTAESGNGKFRKYRKCNFLFFTFEVSDISIRSVGHFKSKGRTHLFGHRFDTVFTRLFVWHRFYTVFTRLFVWHRFETVCLWHRFNTVFTRFVCGIGWTRFLHGLCGIGWTRFLHGLFEASVGHGCFVASVLHGLTRAGFRCQCPPPM